MSFFEEEQRLLWLDPQVNTSAENRVTQGKLKEIINQFKTFKNQKSCYQYILSLSSQNQIILIVSGQYGRELVPQIHHLQQISHIYVFCLNKQVNEQWAKDFRKVRAIVNDPNDLIYELKRNRRQQSQMTEDLSFEPALGGRSGRNNDQSTSKLNGHFVSFLLLIDVFTRIRSTGGDKPAFVKYCRENSIKAAEIADFERNYLGKGAIWWYTCNSFLHKMLNEALRRRNIEVLLLYRFFIADIYRQLKPMQCRERISVYRGQRMFEEELNRLQRLPGELISINSFFSTTISPGKAKVFMKNTHIPNNKYHRVLFIIDADPRFTSNTLFADISNCAAFPEEREILFMIGSIFRLGKIELKNERFPYYEIQMTLCGDNENDLKELFKHMKEDYGGGDENSTLLPLADVLREMGQCNLAQRIYSQCNAELPLNDPLRSSLYKSLGILNIRQDAYEKARYCFNQARTMCMQRKPVNYVTIGDLYNWIGETYRLQGEFQAALLRYSDAIRSFQNAHAETHESLAHVYNNMAIVYGAQKEYSTALTYHEKALEIRRKLPENHPDIAASLNNMGIIYFNLKDYNRALSYYQQSLEIRQKSLSPQHSDIGSSYQNIGQVYQIKSDWKKAMECYRQAADIYTHSLKSDHSYFIQLKKDMSFVSSKMR